MNKYKFWITIDKDKIDMEDIKLALTEAAEIGISYEKLGFILTREQWKYFIADLSRFEFNTFLPPRMPLGIKLENKVMGCTVKIIEGLLDE